jgi:hypothetical protein
VTHTKFSNPFAVPLACLFVLLLVPMFGSLTMNAGDGDGDAVRAVRVACLQENLAPSLVSASVTVKMGDGNQGSGVVVQRYLDDECVSFVWTAGHLFSSPQDAVVVVQYVMDDFGNLVAENTYEARLLAFSEPDAGHDLALLEVLDRSAFPDLYPITFYLSPDLPDAGTPVLHVGSLLGEIGHSSVTSGVLGFAGRTLPGNDKVFDQVSCAILPGSSGGGVFLQDTGECIGLVVRYHGEGFALIVPTRRMLEFTRENAIEWALDPSVGPVSLPPPLNPVLPEDVSQSEPCETP